MNAPAKSAGSRGILCSFALSLLTLTLGCRGRSSPMNDPFYGHADPARGAELIRNRGCGRCHHVPGVSGAEGWVGPPLTAFARRSFISGQLPNTPENLVRWIKDPQSVDPKTAMPRVALNDGQARDIAAYLFSLR
jgi:cytochrome c